MVAQKDSIPFSDYEGDPLLAGGRPKDEVVNGAPDQPPLDDLAGGEGEEEEEGEDSGQGQRTRFTDERFAKLFPTRSGLGGANRSVNPRAVAKPKPTLPSFIKNTAPLIKPQVTTPSSRLIQNRQRVGQNSNKRQSTTTTTTTVRPRNRPTGNERNRSGRLPPAQPTSARAIVSTTPIPSRRRFSQNSGISRFQRNNNNNSTIPALNPRRN